MPNIQFRWYDLYRTMIKHQSFPLAGSFLFLGILLVWLSICFMNSKSLIFYVTETKSSPGIITHKEGTHFTIDDSPVSEYFFSYRNDSNSGSSFAYSIEKEVGQEVTVTYTDALGGYAMMEHFRALPFTIYTFISLCMFCIGCYYIRQVLKWKTLVGHILSDYSLASAKVIKKRETNNEVNEEKQWALTYVYEIKLDKYEYKVETTKPELYSGIEQIAFSNKNPNWAILVCELSKKMSEAVRLQHQIE